MKKEICISQISLIPALEMKGIRPGMMLKVAVRLKNRP
jgi:hypothetical protein